MSDANPGPERDNIYLPPAVEDALDALDNWAYAAGHYDKFAAALDKMYEIFRLYPQLGEPLHNIEVDGKYYLSRVLTVTPLAVIYVIDEDNRSVVIPVPFKAMPNVGFE